jgi:AraC-like DNA-binding protein/quercetin dioxygenase-like cupin family protein
VTDQTCQRLLWRDQRPDGGLIHIARLYFRPGRSFPLHTHDFAEVYWCESGRGSQTINGVQSELTPGHIQFIRPHDAHTAEGDASGFTIVNLAFPPESVAALSDRYPQWPWRATTPQPHHATLTLQQVQRLSEWTEELARPEAGALDLDACLIDLTRMVTRPLLRDAAVDLPGWLRDAIATLCDPRNLSGGSARLATLCGRSQAHINRVIRAAQGRTTTDLINELRMDWAASELRLSDRSIGEIATCCGFENLGHFYRLFHRRFGETPRRYRLAARRAAPG